MLLYRTWTGRLGCQAHDVCLALSSLAEAPYELPETRSNPPEMEQFALGEAVITC